MIGVKRLVCTAGLLMTMTSVQAATCDLTQVTASRACAGQIDGNDKSRAVGALFGITGWDDIARVEAPDAGDGILTITYDRRSKRGTWSVTGWTGVGQAMLVIKGGNGFAAYLIDLAAGLDGTWSTAALTNGGGKRPKVSHVTLYSVPASVPLPAAGLLLAGALGGLAALRRRRAA